MSERMNYTMEEINLMCIYDTSDRYILIREMETVLPFIKGGEIRTLMEKTLDKLYNTSDRDYAELPLFPNCENYDDDEDIPHPEIP